MTSSPPSVGPKDKSDWLNVVMIGNRYFEQPMQGKKENKVFVDKVTKQELKLLQKDINSIIQPLYRQVPPRDLGNPGHGKLKADQWKTCIEFDIPVSVAQLWSRETCPPGQDWDVTACRDKVFQSIMHLAITVHWGTSYQISEHHSQLFEENMVAYLDSCWNYTLTFNFAQITTQPSTLVPSSCNLDLCIAGGCFHLKGSLVSYRKLTQIARMGKCNI